MAVDVSKIPNNSKFDPVREAILNLQAQIGEEGQIAYDGILTINTSGNLTGSGTFTANQSTDTIVSIGITDTPTFTSITTDSLQFTGGDGTQGTLSWNDDEETIDIIQNGATLQVGQETQVHVKNQTGSTIPDGTPVYVTGTLGASGRLTVAPMIADGSIEAKYFLGVTTESIPNGEDGKVTTFGKIRGLDTSAYSEGTTLYVSATTAGAWQTTVPVAPALDLEVAIVIYPDQNNGTLFVRAQNGYYLGMLHDVYLNSPADGQLLVYNDTNSRWENFTHSFITLGDLSVTTNPTPFGSGALLYEQQTGTFEYTPPDLSEFVTNSDLTGYLEYTDLTVNNFPTDPAHVGGYLEYSDTLGAISFYAADVDGLIGLTDLSVTTETASGGGALSYDDTTGVFTFTPADIATGLDLQQVTANGNTTTYGISTGNISVQPAGTGNGVVAISANSVGNAALTLTPGSTAGDGVISTTIERAIIFKPFNTEKVVIASDGNMNVYEKLAVGKTTAASTYAVEVDGIVQGDQFKAQSTYLGTTYSGDFDQYLTALQIRTDDGGIIEIGGNGTQTVQNDVYIKNGDLDVSGNVTADFFVGDGSLLTNIAGANQNLQDVTDNGATTTNTITVGGLISTNVASDSPDIISGIPFIRRHDGTDDYLSSIDDLGTFVLSKTDGGYGGGTKPSGAHNGVGIISMQTHTGNYFSQLALDTNQNSLWIRSANNTSTFGGWNRIYSDGYRPYADNAGTLDGVDSSQFLRSDVDDTMSGILTFAKGSSGILASRTGYSDFLGYNPSYGSYIGGRANNASGYIYAGGYYSDGTTVHTLIHSGNISSQSVNYANTVNVIANDTFSGTYPIVWRDGSQLYSSTWMTVTGATDTLNVPNVNVSGTLTVDGTYDGNFGHVSFSWSGSTTYPTLYSSHPDRWIMHVKPHIVWTQNGQRGYSGTTEGSMIRFEGNLASTVSWDAGCLTDIASGGDYWGVARSGTWAFYSDPSLNLHANSSMRSPIFYDSNNTNFYVDPSSSTRSINVNGYITAVIGDSRGFEIGDGGAHITAAGLGQVVFQGASQLRFGPSNWDYNQWGGITYTGGTTPILYIGGPSSSVFNSNSSPPNTEINFTGTTLVYADSSFRAPIFYDSDNTGYYINPSGLSYVNEIRSNEAQANPRYDTAFYVLQAQHWYGDTSSQTMYIGESGNDVIIRGQVAIGGTAIQSGYALTMSGHVDMNAYDINYVSQLHFNDNVRFYDAGNDSYLNFKFGDSNEGAIRFYDGGGTQRGWLYTDSSGFGLLSADGSWAFRSTNGGNEIYHDVKCPIYYDSNDTNYYLTPSGVNYLNAITATRIGVNPSGSSTSRYGISLYGGFNSGEPTYGLLFTGTSLGTHGSVTGSWATYFTMNNDNSRGWIFRRVGSGNCASISGGGTASFNGDVIAYYSDMRLKTKLGDIEDPIGKIQALNGFYYEPNEVAQSYGYEKETRVGLSAQEVEAVLPEIVTDAPIGDGYKTVDYAKLVPVLVEAIKEQQKQIDELKSLINKS